MRFISIKFILLLSLSFNLFLVQAQFEPKPGYYIATAKDTINTMFRDEPQRSLTYRVICLDSANKSWTSLYPGQIEEFYISSGDRLYQSRQLDSTTGVFIRCLVDGRLDLYSIELNSGTFFYFEDTTGSLIKLECSKKRTETHVVTLNKYVGQLAYAMRDKPEIFNDINKTDYKTKELIHLFEKYNSLTEKQYKVYYKNRTEFIKNIQIGGFYTSKLKSISGSLYGELYNPDLSKRSSIRFGLNLSQTEVFNQVYERYSYSSITINGFSSEFYDTLRYNYREKYQILSLDGSYQFKYYNKICVPYFYVGFSVSIYNYDKVADDPFPVFRYATP